VACTNKVVCLLKPSLNADARMSPSRVARLKPRKLEDEAKTRDEVSLRPMGLGPFAALRYFKGTAGGRLGLLLTKGTSVLENC
jgi:hypothetical protein